MPHSSLMLTLLPDNRFEIRFSLSLRDRSRLRRTCRELRDEETCFAIPPLYLLGLDPCAAPGNGMMGKWLHLLDDFRTVHVRQDRRLKFVSTYVRPELRLPGAGPGPYEVVDGPTTLELGGVVIDYIANKATRASGRLIIEGHSDRDSGDYCWHLYVSVGPGLEHKWVASEGTIHRLVKIAAPDYACFFRFD